MSGTPQRSPLVPVVSLDSVDICSACDLSNFDLRYCTDCLCAYCGFWLPNGAASAPPGKSSESDLQLQQCRVCAANGVDFGTTRVHPACRADAANAAKAFRQPLPALTCRHCNMVLSGEVVATTATDVSVKIEPVDEISAPVPHRRVATSSPHVASSSPQVTPGVTTATPKQHEEEAGQFSSVPNLMRLLLESDPRQMTFETAHYGTLRLALELLQEDEAVPSRNVGRDDLATSTSPEHTAGCRSGSSAAVPHQLLQLRESPYYPPAADRVTLRSSAVTGRHEICLPLLNSTSSKRSRELRSATTTVQESDSIAVRRRQRLEATARAQASHRAGESHKYHVNGRRQEELDVDERPIHTFYHSRRAHPGGSSTTEAKKEINDGVGNSTSLSKKGEDLKMSTLALLGDNLRRALESTGVVDTLWSRHRHSVTAEKKESHSASQVKTRARQASSVTRRSTGFIVPSPVAAAKTRRSALELSTPMK